jgi:hypothetical protein
MATRSAISASVPVGSDGSEPSAARGPPSSGTGDNNHVALARARARAISARVQDLQHVFASYRTEVFGDARCLARHRDVSPGKRRGRATTISASSQSVMGMADEVESHTDAGTRARCFDGVANTKVAQDLEKQFEALVDLLAKQATKLVEDLDTIVMLAQARVARAERQSQQHELDFRNAAGEQIRSLLLVQAIGKFHAKVQMCCFVRWRRTASRTIGRTEWRRRTVRQVVYRLARVCVARSLGQWTAAAESSKMARERAQSEAQLQAASMALVAQHQACIKYVRRKSAKQCAAHCFVSWATWRSRFSHLKGTLFVALDKYYVRLVTNSFEGWRARAKDFHGSEVTRLLSKRFGRAML